MFRPFPNWPSSGWNTMSEELYTYCKYRHYYQCEYTTQQEGTTKPTTISVKLILSSHIGPHVAIHPENN